MNIKLGTEICCVGFEIKWCLKSRIYLSFLLQIHLFNWKFQVPLEGFRALQGISGPQRFQINKAYGAPERLPSAHTWLVLRATWCMNFSAYYFFFNFFDGHSRNGCQKIDACVAIYYKKKEEKENKERFGPYGIYYIIFAVSTNWIFLSILPKNSFKSDCCLPSMKPVKDLALANMATWVIKLYQWGRQALCDWQCTGDLYILFWDWIFLFFHVSFW